MQSMQSRYEETTLDLLRKDKSIKKMAYSRPLGFPNGFSSSNLERRGYFAHKHSRRLKAVYQSYNVMSANLTDSSLNSNSSRIETEKYQIMLSDSHAQRQLNRMLHLSNYSISEFEKSVLDFLETENCEVVTEIQELKESKLHLLFALSAIQDLISWGSTLDVLESQLWLGKTKDLINRHENSENLRDAMTSLKSSEISYFAPITANEALEMLRNGELRLELVSPKNNETSDLFRQGVTTWSMPYRGREGRSARFILWITNKGVKHPVGIMEVGDDAPYSPLRDQTLGFSIPEKESPLNLKMKNRLFELRKTIIPNDLPINPTLELDEFTKVWISLSLDNKSVRDRYSDPSIRKRLSYLNRIYSGEFALSTNDRWNEKDVAAAVRAIKDVTLNRVHTEVVICGALPPFGNLLGGKLVAMMMNHPLVRATLDRDIGVLLAGSFDKHKIEKWLPRFGPLLTTTKGLFPNHSSQYNRVRIPLVEGSVKLQKLGLTQGQTMSHIGNRTMSFAVEINSRMGDKGISREYGSGGAKRQRILQSAARHVGIDANALYADVTRPVYGCLFLLNPQGVVLGGESPEWKDHGMPAQTAQEYEGAALSLWREKWLGVAENRTRNIGS
jgi:hypothetical protein